MERTSRGVAVPVPIQVSSSEVAQKAAHSSMGHRGGIASPPRKSGRLHGERLDRPGRPSVDRIHRLNDGEAGCPDSPRQFPGGAVTMGHGRLACRWDCPMARFGPSLGSVMLATALAFDLLDVVTGG